MITPTDVIMALSWSGETVELKDLINLFAPYFASTFIGSTASAGSCARRGRRRRFGTTAGALRPARTIWLRPLVVAASSRSAKVLAVRCWRARIYGVRFPRVPSERASSGAPCSAFVREHHADRRCGPARAARHQSVRRDHADVHAGGSGYAAGCVGITDHDGKLVASSPTAICAGICGLNLPRPWPSMRIMTPRSKTVAPDQP